jgi:hypothetical protein
MRPCNHLIGQPEVDGYGWIVIAAFALYIAVVFRLDLWLWEKGLRWHSGSDMDYANVLDPNVQANVARAADKQKKKQADDEDKNAAPPGTARDTPVDAGTEPCPAGAAPLLRDAASHAPEEKS